MPAAADPSAFLDDSIALSGAEPRDGKGAYFRDSSPNLARIVSSAYAKWPATSTADDDMASISTSDQGHEGGDALHILRTHGAVILRDAVPAPLLAECRAAVGRITSSVVAAAKARTGSGGEIHEGFDDPKVLDSESRRRLGITRIAQIGAGKKNVHFDPYVVGNGEGSARHPHAAMEALAEAAGMAGLIRSYCGKDVTLAETGLSITRPGGGGLEWHADGREGECTAIMSVDDLPPSMGTLALILGSHEALDRDTSEDFDAEVLEVVAAEERENQNAGKVSYAYRSGQPIVFDARMLHAAEGSSVKGGGQEQGEEGETTSSSTPEGFRVILWWIFN